MPHDQGGLSRLLTTFPAAPSIQAPSHASSVVHVSISMAEFFEEDREEEAFDEPLSDHEWSDSEEDPGPPDVCAPGGQDTTLNTRALYKRHRFQTQRNLMRSGITKNTSTGPPGEGVKQHVLRHRTRAAWGVALLVDFSMALDANVTAPGWVGKTLKKLPQEPLGLDQLCTEHGLTLFRWDGR